MTKTPFAALASLVFMAACSSDGGTRTPTGPVVHAVELGREFHLRPGDRAEVESSEGFAVTFLGVREDSRCPVDVQCVWSGDAAVALEVAIGRRAPETVTLHTHLEPRATAIFDHIVRLIRLEPPPRTDRPIRPSDYVVTLTVDRPE